MSQLPIGGKRPNRARVAQAQRFFARPISFDLECPRCGRVYQVRPNSPDGKRNFDALTGRLTCTGKDCGRIYIIGLLAWPIGTANDAGSAPPRDQVPNARQLGQLRKEGGGWWLADSERINDTVPVETNLTLEETRPVDRAEEED